MSATNPVLAVLSGKNMATGCDRLFRQLKVYVASNWNDCKLERRTLFDEVLPRLRRYGLQSGLDVSFVDVQCGAPYDHAFDPLVLQSHLNELEECSHTSYGPCFICVLNERTDGGDVLTPVLPITISAEVMNKLRTGVAHDLLDKWYRKSKVKDNYVFCNLCDRFPQLMNIDAEKSAEALKTMRQEHRVLVDLVSKHMQLKSAVEMEVQRALELSTAKFLFVFHAPSSSKSVQASNGTPSLPSPVQNIKQRVLANPNLAESVIMLRSNIDSHSLSNTDAANSEPSDDDADDVATFQRSFSDQLFSRLLRIVDTFWSKSDTQDDTFAQLIKHFEDRSFSPHAGLYLLNNVVNCVYYDDMLPRATEREPAKWACFEDDARHTIDRELQLHVRTITEVHSPLTFKLANGPVTRPAEDGDAVIASCAFLSESFVPQQFHRTSKRHFASVSQQPLFLVLDADDRQSNVELGASLLSFLLALPIVPCADSNGEATTDDAVVQCEQLCFSRIVKLCTQLSRPLQHCKSVLVISILNVNSTHWDSLIALLTGKVPANVLVLITTRLSDDVLVHAQTSAGSEESSRTLENCKEDVRSTLNTIECSFQAVSESCHYAFRLIMQLIAINVDGIEEAHVYDFLRQAAVLSTESHDLYAIWMWHTLKSQLLQHGLLQARFAYRKLVFYLTSAAVREAVQHACFQTRNIHDPPDAFRWLHRSMLSHLYQLDEPQADTKRDSCTSMKTSGNVNATATAPVAHRLSHASNLKALPKISSFDADEIFEARTKQRRYVTIALQYGDGEYNVTRLQLEWFHFVHAKNFEELPSWFQSVFSVERQLAIANTMSINALVGMLEVICKHFFTADLHVLHAIFKCAQRILLENPSQLAAEIFLHAQHLMCVTQPQNGPAQRSPLLNTVLQQCVEVYEKRDDQITLIPLSSWIKPIVPLFDIQIEAPCGSGPAALLLDNQHLYWITDANKCVTKFSLPSGEMVKCLERHTDKQFTCLIVSNDDSKLYVGSSDCTVRQYSTRTEELQHLFTGHRDAVTCVATTLDGKLMCSGSKDKTIRIYNTNSKQLVSCTTVHDGPVRCVLFSKSAQLTITGGADFKVKVWFVDDMSPMHVFEEYVTPITAIVLTPDTSFLLIACEDRRLSVKSLISGKDVHELETIQEYATSLSVSSDCHHVAVGCADAFTYIYNLRTMDLIQRIPPPCVNVLPVAVAVTPSLHRASVSGTSCHESPVISHTNSQPTRGLARAMSIASPVGHSTGRMNADSASKTGSTESGLAGEAMRTLVYPCLACDRYLHCRAHPRSPGNKPNSDAVKSVQFTRCGQNVLITQRGCVRLARVNLASRMQMFVDSFQHSRKVTCICLSRDGRIAATGSDDNVIKIWNMLICDFVLNLVGHDSGILTMQISNDEQFLVSAGRDRRCIVWSTQTGRLFLKYTEHESEVMQMALFGEDDEYGIRCVSLDTAGITKLWRIDTGETFITVKSLQFNGLPIAVTANFQLVFGSTSPNSIAVCMLSDGRVMQQISHKEKITCFTLSKDSQYIITGSVDTSLKVWQARTGRLTQVLAEHENDITCVAITDSNQRVVSGSQDCTAIIWDVGTGAVCNKLTAHCGAVTQVRITQDNNIILTASLDKTVRVWSLQSGMQLTWFYVHYPVIDMQVTFDASRILLRLERSCNLAVLSLRVTDKYLEKIELEAPKVAEVQVGGVSNPSSGPTNPRAKLQRSMTMPANVIPQEAAPPGSACIAYRHRQSPFKQTTLINMFRQQEKNRQQRLQTLLRRSDAWLLGSRVSANLNRSTKTTTTCTML